jgi:hypothetical protein
MLELSLIRKSPTMVPDATDIQTTCAIILIGSGATADDNNRDLRFVPFPHPIPFRCSATIRPDFIDASLQR